MKKIIYHFMLLGFSFLLVEYVFRCISYDTNNFHPALLLMFFIGGLCGLLIGVLNERAFLNQNVNVFWQSVIGTIIILIIEYFSGLIVNVWLGLNVWSYANYPFNLNGQICLMFAGIWFLMCPFGFWLDDVLRYYIYGGVIAPYKLFEIYSRAWNPFDRPFI